MWSNKRVDDFACDHAKLFYSCYQTFDINLKNPTNAFVSM